MILVRYDASDLSTLNQALKCIKEESGVRYIFGGMFTTNHREVLEKA
jgi:hypothetical protein